MHTVVVAPLVAVLYIIIQNAIPTIDVILWLNLLPFYSNGVCTKPFNS